ncbi:hypothetical protein COO60DRAFT_271879 [Scenedesmus sp. NREL 46B-D3]|nr:hypothetical protein COO60DRAFT_271879 [Scenedesmus sp. NREL 46B-D3]
MGSSSMCSAMQPQQRLQEQQLHPVAHVQGGSGLAVWRSLEATAAVPSPEQLLLLLEAALLDPLNCTATAVALLLSALLLMEQYACALGICMAAGAELLLQPVLQLLGPAIMHAAASSGDTGRLGMLASAFSVLVAAAAAARSVPVPGAVGACRPAVHQAGIAQPCCMHACGGAGNRQQAAHAAASSADHVAQLQLHQAAASWPRQQHRCSGQ